MNAIKFDLVGKIIDFEGGLLDDAGVIELFQHLVDTGKAWTLQGSYGRTARALIEAGYVTDAKREDLPNSEKDRFEGGN